MKYKIGDKVKVREDLELGKLYYMENSNTSDTVDRDMLRFKGRTVIIESYHYGEYLIEEDDGIWCWTDEMFGELEEDVEIKENQFYDMENIPYKDIDVNCREFVSFFNSIHLKTKFSCSGHENSERENSKNYEIIFCESVSDGMIIDFIEMFENEYTHSPFLGRFVKWARKLNGKVQCNWIYQLTYNKNTTNVDFAKEDLEKFKAIDKEKFFNKDSIALLIKSKESKE